VNAGKISPKLLLPDFTGKKFIGKIPGNFFPGQDFAGIIFIGKNS